jgi:hypothetical protein
MRSSLVPAALAGGVAVFALAPVAEAHSIPRLYGALAPSAVYDPLQGRAFVGGGLLLGLGVDPEVDALLLRIDVYASYGNGPRALQPLFGLDGALLYRKVWRKRDGVVWTWALGPAVIAAGGDNLGGGTFGVRGELGVRFYGVVGFTAFAIAGPTVGENVRIPWGAPMGLAIDLGLP